MRICPWLCHPVGQLPQAWDSSPRPHLATIVFPVLQVKSSQQAVIPSLFKELVDLIDHDMFNGVKLDTRISVVHISSSIQMVQLEILSFCRSKDVI